jgi:heme-degrading monooxygenase HmoA
LIGTIPFRIEETSICSWLYTGSPGNTYLLKSPGEVVMFVNIVEFPPIKKGKDEEFKEWFKESNAAFMKHDGFISRRLLVSDKGSYAAIVEHQSKGTFMKMHTSKEHEVLRAKGDILMDGNPKPHFYDVVDL